MTSHANELLTAYLVSKGWTREQAEAAVGLLLGAALRAQIIERKHLTKWEESASIYHLRGKGMTGPALSVRFGVSRAWIFEAIRRHAKLRRAALRDDPFEAAG